MRVLFVFAICNITCAYTCVRACVCVWFHNCIIREGVPLKAVSRAMGIPTPKRKGALTSKGQRRSVSARVGNRHGRNVTRSYPNDGKGIAWVDNK